MELESLCNWTYRNHQLENVDDLKKSIEQHISAARDAAGYKKRFRVGGGSSLVQRAMGNLDAAEAQLLNFAPTEYILGQMPSLLHHVQRHLTADDPRRQELERIVQETTRGPWSQEAHDEQLAGKIDHERGRIVTAVRGASSAALREQRRVASFRNVVVATTVVMTVLAVGLAIMGIFTPAAVPLCFEPEKAGQTVVVCPTAQSAPQQTGQQSGPTAPDVDDVVAKTAQRTDLFVIELIGLIAAAVAAATSIRGIRGSSEPYGLPVALAALKLPTGAITAFLGLLFMRGQFIPGLSPLDTSAQILGWAIIFGYSQELFTRFIDQQGHAVLNTVRGADKGKKISRP
ncbi:MAG: hypothetical protein M3143_02415 [Actinomycetota bacterium]|nr:hypothetical protein [Actinomycetota bacterium]